MYFSRNTVVWDGKLLPRLRSSQSYSYRIMIWGYEPPGLSTPRSYVYTRAMSVGAPLLGSPVYIAISSWVYHKKYIHSNNNDI